MANSTLDMEYERKLVAILWPFKVLVTNSNWIFGSDSVVLCLGVRLVSRGARALAGIGGERAFADSL